jgi:hypothetical protein
MAFDLPRRNHLNIRLLGVGAIAAGDVDAAASFVCAAE